jgi:hypothetical protein
VRGVRCNAWQLGGSGPGTDGGLGCRRREWIKGGIAQASENSFGASLTLTLKLIQSVFERPKAEVSFAFRTIQPVEESGHVNHARARLQKVEIKQLLTGHSTHIQKPLNIAFKLSSRILRAEIATIPPLLLLAQAALVYNSFESTTKS